MPLLWCFTVFCCSVSGDTTQLSSQNPCGSVILRVPCNACTLPPCTIAQRSCSSVSMRWLCHGAQMAMRSATKRHHMVNNVAQTILHCSFSLATAMQEVAVLQQQLAEMSQDLAEARSGRDRASSSFSSAQRRSDELEPQLAELRSSYEDARGKATQRREEISRLQAEREADRAELQRLRTKYARLHPCPSVISHLWRHHTMCMVVAMG